MSESLAVTCIAAVLVAILVPVLANAKRGGQIENSVSRVRQLFLALEQYRQDEGGIEGDYGTATTYSLGLPLDYEGFHFPTSFWLSPCGFDSTIDSTELRNFPASITYAAGFYSPNLLSNKGSANFKWYHDYIARYQQNAVVILDGNCNPPGTQMNNPFSQKRGIAALLSGQLVNRIREGNAYRLEFYSNLP